MLRRLTGAVALTCLLTLFTVPAAESDPVRSDTMQFSLRRDAPASCAENCRSLVFASGMIKADTVRDFESFAARHDLRGATLVLNSEGGSVLGALALGRAVRRLGMATTVGRSVNPQPKGGLLKAAAGGDSAIEPRADCESMCAFVLLAGIKRMVPEEARVRVHQIWLGDRRDDAVAATYSAEDLVLVQRDIGKIAQYTVEMGGGIELLEVALRIPPWEPMRALTREELRHMRLDTERAGPPSEAAPSMTDATPVTTGSLRRMSAGVERSGWAMAAREGRKILTRHHPLTAEGEDLGRFELSLSCGGRPNEYAVTYSETRRAGAHGQVPQPLKAVQLRLGYKEVALTLARSEAAPGAVERVSQASGVLGSAVLAGFAASGSRSLTVMTDSADGTATSIRLGNTGAAQHLPQLAAACAQARTEHAGLVERP